MHYTSSPLGGSKTPFNVHLQQCSTSSAGEMYTYTQEIKGSSEILWTGSGFLAAYLEHCVMWKHCYYKVAALSFRLVSHITVSSFHMYSLHYRRYLQTLCGLDQVVWEQKYVHVHEISACLCCFVFCLFFVNRTVYWIVCSSQVKHEFWQHEITPWGGTKQLFLHLPRSTQSMLCYNETII